MAAAVAVEEVDTRSFCDTKNKSEAEAEAEAEGAAKDGTNILGYNLLSSEASANAFRSELRRRKLAEREGHHSALTDVSALIAAA